MAATKKPAIPKLEIGADIVIMLHPDYQYTPKLLVAMISIIGNGILPGSIRLTHFGWRCLERRHAYV